MLKAPTRASILLPIVLAATACVGGRPIVTAQNAPCASLLPAEWKAGVAGADLPPIGATVGDWIAFADAQTGRLDAANDRTRASIGVVERCEARHAAAVRQITRRRVLGVF